MGFREKLERLKVKIAGARKSITIWFNTVAGVLAYNIDWLHSFIPQIQAYIDDHVFKQAMLWIIVAGNLLLRFKTKTDLSDK